MFKFNYNIIFIIFVVVISLAVAFASFRWAPLREIEITQFSYLCTIFSIDIATGSAVLLNSIFRQRYL